MTESVRRNDKWATKNENMKGRIIMNKSGLRNIIWVMAFMAVFLGFRGDICEAAEKKEFVLCYLPSEAADQYKEARSQLSDALSEAIGMKVVEVNTTDFIGTVEVMRTGKADMALFGPLTYAQALKRVAVEPLVVYANNADKSQSTYVSYLVANAKDDSIRSIKDIKGKVMAFADPNSTSGNLVPSYEIIKAFPEEKLTMDDLHLNGVFFESVFFSGAQKAGLQAVANGDVDLVPAASMTFDGEMRVGNISGETVKIIHSSNPIPGSPWTIRSALDPELKRKVKEFLIAYNNEAYFDQFHGSPTGRYLECSPEEYRDIIELNDLLQP
ncbi:MAG: phosphate/phosphite/phosphonate ABC transporter substrate-binding protein [Synergistaceae bacterium]|nr:phosphate/phosphite/phosphonate ABC transporter substrate-binding protein [Synergistaceae bacterium]